MTMGPGGGSDPGNAGRGGSAGRGAAGGGGRGNNTPGHPGNDGRRGNSAPNGRGNNTPGNPSNPGNNSSSGRGSNTPGAPSNPGRRGQHAAGSTPTSRARDAMSRHQSERNRRSIAAGGLTGDADDNAGLGLANAMDAQRTESALNDAGVTDSLGMSAVDKLGTAVAHGAMLSDTENQQRRGIVAGYNSQFSANRISDVTGLPGVVTDTAASMFGRPPGTMERDVNIGRARANDKEMGGLMQTGLGIGMSELGISAPMNAVNFGQAVARSATDTNMNSLRTGTHQSRYGSRPSRQGPTGTPGTARTAMMARAQSPQKAFEWSPVNLNSYSQGLLSLAMNTQR